MSTVMRPVGPLPPRIYWIRRSGVFVILLIVIVLLATQCGGGGGGKPNTGRNTGGAHPNPTTSTTTAPTTPACVAADLKVTVSTDTTTYTVGQAPTLTATLANPGTTTCKLARLAANEIWTIKSGTPVVWTTDGCPSTAVSPQIKLPAGGTKPLKLTWNGHLRGANCKDGDSAQPGTYRLFATIDGVKAKNPAIFHIIA